MYVKFSLITLYFIDPEKDGSDVEVEEVETSTWTPAKRRKRAGKGDLVDYLTKKHDDEIKLREKELELQKAKYEEDA